MEGAGPGRKNRPRQLLQRYGQRPSSWFTETTKPSLPERRTSADPHFGQSSFAGGASATSSSSSRSVRTSSFMGGPQLEEYHDHTKSYGQWSRCSSLFKKFGL